MKLIVKFLILILFVVPFVCSCSVKTGNQTENNPITEIEKTSNQESENITELPTEDKNEKTPEDNNGSSDDELTDNNPGEDKNEKTPEDNDGSGDVLTDNNSGGDNDEKTPEDNDNVVELTELKVIAIEMTGTYGDSFLIKYGDFEILVDAGTTDDKAYVQAVLSEFVEDKELDILMVSHLHADHIGAMTSTSFFDSIGVGIKTIVDPGTKPSTATARNYVSMRNSFVSKGTVYYTYYDIINDASIETIWYLDEVNNVFIEFFDTGTMAKLDTTPSDMNSSSFAFALNYNINKWLFAGDLPSGSEATLVANIKKIDENYFNETDYVVLKADHHGSNGSNSDELLSFVKPDMVFIMAGIVDKNQNNQTISSQHPYLKALNRIRKYTEKVYWTSINGLSIFTSTGNEVTFDARGRTVNYYYNGKIVSTEEEQYVTIFESKWFLMMK